MQALILAAGRGSRMGILTKTTPKPLLKIGKTTLIENNIHKLQNAKITDIVVNTHYLADKIIKHLKKYDIKFSNETTELETAGGIINAISSLENTFIVINADVFSDYNLQNLKLPQNSLAHLVLVKNPEHNPTGDFYFKDQKYTFSGIGIYDKKLFTNYKKDEKLALGKVLKDNLENISFEVYNGKWLDVGTPERLETANNEVKNRNKYCFTDNSF